VNTGGVMAGIAVPGIVLLTAGGAMLAARKRH